MKKTIYIETTIVSYYTAWRSRDIIIAGHQEITREWWNKHLPRFKPMISEFVIQEARGGDAKASKHRLDVLSKIPLLDINADIENLAREYVLKRLIPRKNVIDALHISCASVHGIDYLVTWNCAHIANAEMREKLLFITDLNGYKLPVICTPEELMGDEGL